MKVCRLHGRYDVRVSEESIPRGVVGNELVRLTCVGICGSDLHWYEEGGIGDAQFERPLVLGHEPAGVIFDGPREGTRVAVDPAVSCDRCSFCAEGNPNLCSDLRFAGHGLEDGAFREMMVWPSSSLIPVPDVLSDLEIAMLEPLGVAIHAVSLGKVRPDVTVAVFGCGPIGLLILQVVLNAGAGRVVATDRLPHRLEAARRLGAAETVLAGQDGEVEAVLAATNGEGVAVGFEAATENAAVETAIACARPGGRVVLVGIPDDDRTSFSASIARRKGLTIKLARRMKHTYPRAIKYVVDKKIDVASLVSHRFSIDQAAEAFAVASGRNGLKVVIDPT
ncbi:MAG: alcohol dehydrogenase catalytic domain-containing protein [Rhodothermia bacterium]|nr:alcohol dehydrogenase catalytic domain-containing protein [Rhodothermia bacterium]